MPLTKLQFDCNQENQASRSVVEQCGNHEMQDTGRSTENEIITDESAHNIIQVELLECRVNSDWKIFYNA